MRYAISHMLFNTQYAIRNPHNEIVSTLVVSALQIHLFLTNKANFQKSQINLSDLLISDYEQMDTWSIGKNKANSKPKQTQFKPNLSCRSLWRSRNKANFIQPRLWKTFI